MKSIPLETLFEKYFSLLVADTDTLKEQVFRLRYEVYCKEFGYEPTERFPDGMERDSYDGQSLHVLLVHKSSDLSAGCLRMVPTDPTDPCKPLPFEAHRTVKLDPKRLTELNLPRSSVCEISRLAVAKTFRRRPKESDTCFGSMDSINFEANEERTFPLIAVTLFLAGCALTELENRCNLFAMMDPSLPIKIARLGFHFIRVGDIVEYRGKRAPYFVTTRSLLKYLKPKFQRMYGDIRDEFEKSLRGN